MHDYFVRNAPLWKTRRHKKKIKLAVGRDFCRVATRQIDAAIRAGVFEAANLDAKSGKAFEEYLADVFLSYTEGVGFQKTNNKQLQEAQTQIVKLVQRMGRLFRDNQPWQDEVRSLGEYAFVIMDTTPVRAATSTRRLIEVTRVGTESLKISHKTVRNELA